MTPGASAARDGPPVLPVSLLVSSARLILERQLGVVWVGGEISNLYRAPSGHVYFTLKDESAQVRCALWRSKAQLVAFPLRDGLAVEVRATPSIYEQKGEFQLNVDTVRHAGLGALYERFLRLKSALEARACSTRRASARCRAFPWRRDRHLPARRGGARCPGHTAPALARSRRHLYPARVQGEGAAAEIAEAIARQRRAEVDVLIVGRGGGSLEDLWAFNEEVVARARLRLRDAGRFRRRPRDRLHDLRFRRRRARAHAHRRRDARGPRSRGQSRTGRGPRAPARRGRRSCLTHARAQLARPRRPTPRASPRAAGGAAQRVAGPRGTARPRRGPRRIAGSARRSLGAAGAVRCANCGPRYRGAAPGRVRDRVASRGPRPPRRATSACRSLAQRLAHLNPRAVLERGYAIVARGTARSSTTRPSSRPGEAVALTFARGAAEAPSHVEVTRPRLGTLRAYTRRAGGSSTQASSGSGSSTRDVAGRARRGRCAAMRGVARTSAFCARWRSA